MIKHLGWDLVDILEDDEAFGGVPTTRATRCGGHMGGSSVSKQNFLSGTAFPI